MSNKSHLLINEQALQVLPSLAVAIGLNEAIALQQIHYWLNNAKNAGRIDKDGNKWVYNTYSQWKEDNFPFWSEDKIQRIFLSLEKQEVLISRQLDAKMRDMTKFYRIDYDKLCVLDGLKSASSMTAKLHDVKMNQRLPEITTETSFFTAKENAELEQKWQEMMKNEQAAQTAEQNGTGWRGRELLPAQYVAYGDWWYAKTGLHMYGAKAKAKVDSGWLKAFKDLYENDVTIASLDEAMKSNEWRTISNPAQIVNDAKAIQAAPKSVQSSHNVEIDSDGIPETY